MIDLLLKFDSQEQAGLIGEQLGYTIIDPKTGEFKTTQATLSMAICIIGPHFYPDGTTVDGPFGEPEPHKVSDGKYWVMVRSLEDITIPPEIQPFIVELNPDDPMIPSQRWAD
jgi:hypothetical protein